MRTAHLSRLGAVVLACGAISGAVVSLGGQARAAEPLAKGDGPVFWIPIDDGPEAVPGGMMDKVTVSFVRRQVEKAKEAKASVIVFHIKTFGGDSRAMLYIAKAIREARPIPTVAFVDDQALSAGVLIAIACDKIYMEDLSTMGAAQGIFVSQDGKIQTVPEKFASAFRAFFRAEVERRADKSDFPEAVTAIAEAMTDPNVEVLLVEIDGVRRFVRRMMLEGTEDDGYVFGGKSVKVLRAAVAKGTLLTMTAKEAYEEYHFIDGVVTGREEVLERIGRRAEPIVVVRKSWPEELARFIAGPVVGGLLVMAASIGIMMLVFTSGKSLGGLILLFAMGLFFWSHMVAGEAGPVEVVLFLMGVALLAVEVFLIPGFGIAGIGGVVLILASLVLAFVPGDLVPPAGGAAPFSWSELRSAMFVVLLAVAAGIAGIVVLARFLPYMPLFGRMVLETPDASEAAPAQGGAAGLASLVGARGVCHTDLRPAGKIEIEGEVVDAVSDAEFLARGEAVTVSEVSGNRLVVTQRSPEAPKGPAPEAGGGEA